MSNSVKENDGLPSVLTTWYILWGQFGKTHLVEVRKVVYTRCLFSVIRRQTLLIFGRRFTENAYCDNYMIYFMDKTKFDSKF